MGILDIFNPDEKIKTIAQDIAKFIDEKYKDESPSNIREALSMLEGLAELRENNEHPKT